MKEFEILHERVFSNDQYTISHLYAIVNGVKTKICDAIEDTDRGLTDDMTVEEINKKKVYGETAIPYGRYEIRMDIQSPKYSNYAKYAWAKKYGAKLPRFMNVKGYSGVLAHVGNKATDSDGCVIIGLNKEKGMVLESKATFQKLMDNYLIPAYKSGYKIYWNITKNYK